jgi:hypothetical protein
MHRPMILLKSHDRMSIAIQESLRYGILRTWVLQKILSRFCEWLTRVFLCLREAMISGEIIT